MLAKSRISLRFRVVDIFRLRMDFAYQTIGFFQKGNNPRKNHIGLGLSLLSHFYRIRIQQFSQETF